MKIKPKHFKQLKQGIERAIDALPPGWVETFRKNNGYNDELTRWGVFWFARHKEFLMVGDGIGIPGIPLYGYLNDDHIDTALRRIIGTRFDKPQ